MRKKLLNNWALKLASLALAAILWFLVVTIEDPMDTKSFSNITVRLINTELLDKQNKVYEVLDDTDSVNVVVRAPKSTLDKMRASDIVAEADMSKLTDINTIGISFSAQNVDSVDSIEGNHDVVRLNVEDKNTKWIKVNYDIVGNVPDSYMVAGAALDQTLIEVSGPKSQVERVDYAGVQFDVTGAISNQSANLDITLYDSEDQEVDADSLRTNVNYVRMTVDVLAVKEVPIEVNYSGEPEDGYMATGVVLSDPETVKIAGSTYTLAAISKITIPEETIDITGENSDKTETINLKDYLPDNIRLADSSWGGKVNVTVYIEPIVEKTLEIPAENITITNVPNDLEAALPEDTTVYTLHVSGLDAQITPLRQAAVRGTVDVNAWMEEQQITKLEAGTYTLPITFALAEEVTRDDVTVKVTFTKAE